MIFIIVHLIVIYIKSNYIFVYFGVISCTFMYFLHVYMISNRLCSYWPVKCKNFVSCRVWTSVKVYENAKVHDTTGSTGLIIMHANYCHNIK